MRLRPPLTVSAYGFDDLNQITQTVGFAYDEIDARVFGNAPAEINAEAALECQRRIWQWVYQPPTKDLEGFLCRCIISCWIFVPELRAFSMTEMAGRFGKKKQSLERWVSDFKKEFPAITKHIQHLK